VGDVIKVQHKVPIPRGKVKKAEVTRRGGGAYPQGVRRSDWFRDQVDAMRRSADTEARAIGTRIFRARDAQLRTVQFMKIISLAPKCCEPGENGGIMEKIRKGDQWWSVRPDKAARAGLQLAEASAGLEHQSRQAPSPRPTPGQPAAGIIEKEMPACRAESGVWNPAAKKGDRVGNQDAERRQEGALFKSNAEVIDA